MSRSVYIRRRIAAAAVPVAVAAGAFLVIRGGDDGPGRSGEEGERARPPAAEVAERPNVVVIMTDDQNVAQMRALPRTTALIGDAGVSFEQNYATDPLCCPSRVSFLTGQYAHNHGVISNAGPNAFPALRERDTLGVWLRRAGYRTAFVGKFLNEYGIEDPEHVPPGWDEWHALVDPSTQDYVEYDLNEDGRIVHYGPDPAEYKTTVLGEKARAAIRRGAGGGRPFFLYVGFNAPHAPSTPAPGDDGTFAGRAANDSPAFAEADRSDKPEFIREHPPLDDAALARIADRDERALESLLEVDRQTTAIVEELERLGELDDTYVFFTSDNGYIGGEHGIEFGKLLAYQGSSRVPLLVRGPGIPAGETSLAFTGNIDLAPTIEEISGAEPTVETDGISLLPLAEDPSLTSERPLVIESLIRDRSTYYGYPYAAIRTERYLYVAWDGGEVELYDYERDPHELESVAGDPAYAETEAALADALAERRDCAGEPCREPLEPPPDPE